MLRQSSAGFTRISIGSKRRLACALRTHLTLLNTRKNVKFRRKFTAAAQVFLKMGVDSQLDAPWHGLSNLFSPWILVGVLAMLVSLFSWLYALKSIPLVMAFNLAATNHIMVAIGSWIFLGEGMSIRRWVGIFLVALGAVFIARPLARVEEKL